MPTVTDSNTILQRIRAARGQGPAVAEKGLCELCQGISLQALLSPRGFEHISDPVILCDSAITCRMCSLVYESVARVHPNHALRYWYDTSGAPRFTILRGLGRKNSGLSQILVCCGVFTDGPEDLNDGSVIPPGTKVVGRLEISADKGDPAAKFVKIRENPRDPGSEDGMFMATQLLEECMNMHSFCRAPQTPTLPTRVLDVGSVNDDTIFLCVSDGRKAKYAALSYCWGGQQNVVANDSSLEAMTQGISLASLPKTIRDAVIATQRLGLQYLWVDALCVLQDSKEDWASESSKMGVVYGNAFVTIAAAGADSCNAGCFIQDHAGMAQDSIKIRLPDTRTGTITISVQNVYQAWRDPLNKRAWALQERLLSPRLLIYSLGKISWQCQTKVSMTGIGSSRLPDMFFNEASLEYNEVKLWRAEVNENSSPSLADSWNQVCLDYSRRAITYDDDRLPALSGLARKFQDLTGDVYLAGHWKETLCTSLMWHHGAKPRYQPRPYIAPSWSWLSVPGPILCVHCARTIKSPPICEIIEVKTVPSGLDNLGAVLSGQITLRGQLKQAWERSPEVLCGVDGEEQVGCSLLDFEAEPMDGVDDTLWCVRLFEDRGLLLMPFKENFLRIGIFLLDLDGNKGKTGRKWFEDGESRILTIV